MVARLRPILVVLALAFSAAPASALVLQRFTLGDLVSRSVAVVRGVVRGSAAAWNADHSRIYTTWRVEVQEPVYGAQRGQVLPVITMGGQVGDVRMHVQGSPRLAEGEEVLLFLVPNGEAFSVAGMSQGKFSVLRPASGGVPRLGRDVPAASSDLPDAPTLDGLVERVRALRKGVTP